MTKDDEHPATNTQSLEGKPMVVDEPEPLEVSAARSSVKLQPFWPNKAQNWFLLAEITFDLQAVKSEKQKYLHTLSSLSPETCDCISDFLTNPPTTDQYIKLKQVLLERLAPSFERQLEALISDQDLGDRKPSDALRRIRTLAGKNFSEKIIRSLWIKKMPEIIKIALVAQPETLGIDALAKTADKMYDVINIGQQASNVSAVSYRQSRPTVRLDHTPSTSQNANSLVSRIARLEAKMDGLFRDRSNANQNRESSRSRSRSRSSSNYSRRHGRCWYHVKFGKAAKKCIPPCNFSSAQQSTSRNTNVDVVDDGSKNDHSMG